MLDLVGDGDRGPCIIRRPSVGRDGGIGDPRRAQWRIVGFAMTHDPKRRRLEVHQQTSPRLVIIKYGSVLDPKVTSAVEPIESLEALGIHWTNGDLSTLFRRGEFLNLHQLCLEGIDDVEALLPLVFDRCPALRNLALPNCNVHDEHILNVIPQARAKLTGLYLCYNPVTDRLGPPLASCDHLEHLSVRQSRISDSFLLHFGRLTRLVLSRTEITDEGVEYASQNTGLEMLYLNGTKITDEALFSIGFCERLEALYLDHTNVSGAAILRHLADWPCLKYLSLEGVGISQHELEELRGMAPKLGIGITQV